MAEDLIRYDLMVQDALRGVVKRVLTDAAREGLSGEHHFYVSFRTEAPGVRMSQRLREKYPQDMTIVLQHQFWDLGITEHAFEVGLSFSGVPERLLVPFDALSGFFDPSVQFGLKFDLQEEGETAEEAEPPSTPTLVKTGPRGAASEPTEIKPRATGSNSGLAAISGPPKVGPALAAAKKADEGSNDSEKPGKDASTEKVASKDGAEVVSLDSFRKKN
ncbi:MAG: ClpXP protease specificity-enhancing factor SspB [Methylobacterium sp.]